MSNRLKGHFFAAFCVLIWGTTFVSSRYLLYNLTATELLMYRFIIGLVTLFIMNPHIFKWQGIYKEKYFILAGLSGVTLYYLLENVSLLHTSTSNVSIIVSLAPFFTAFLMQLFYKERCSKYFYIGGLLAIIGIVFICMTEDGIKFHPLGDGLAILAAFIWGIYSIAMKKIVEFKCDAIQYTRRIFSYGIAGMSVFVVLFNFKWSDIVLVNTPFLIANLIMLGIIACAVCFVVWNLSIKHIGAVTSSTYIYVIPVVTIIFSTIFLHEKITAYGIIGVILTILGLVISGKK